MASQKEYVFLVSMNATLQKGFQSSFGKAQQSMVALQKEMISLAKQQSDISAYEKQQKAVENAEKKLEVLQKQYDNIQKEIQETEGFSSSLENKLLSQQLQIDKASESLDKKTRTLEEMEGALKEAGVDTANLTGESKRLEEEMGRLRNEQDKTSESAGNFGERSAAAISAISSAIVAAGIADKVRDIGVAYMETVRSAGNFEASMSQVAATMGVSKEDVKELGEYAKEMGATTAFTAIQASEGLNILAMAGLNAKDQIAGLPIVLDLAAAGGMEMAESSSYITGAVKGFKDQMEHANYYADLMAKGATLANTRVRDLGEAFSISSSTARSYGQQADSLTLSLLRLADQNMVGSEAGRGLMQVMKSVYAPVKKAREALDELGVSAYDLATGKARDLNDVIDDINAALSTYSDEQANAIKSTIFSSRSLNAFNMMCASSEERVEELWKGIGDAGGSSAQQAATQLDNMNGELTIMKSAAEGVSISLGELYKDEFRGLYAAGTEILTMLNQFIKDNPALIKGVITSGAALGTLTTGITSVTAATKALHAVRKAMAGAQLAGIAIPGVGGIMAAVAAVTALTGAITYLYAVSDQKAISDMTKEARGLEKAMRNLHDAYEDTALDNVATAETARMFINRLRELEEVGELDDTQKREYHNTLELLKATMPDLADRIDTVNDTIEGGIPAVEEYVADWQKLAEEQAKQQFAAELQHELSAALAEQMKNQQKLTAAQIKGRNASEKQAEAYSRLLAALGMTDEELKRTYGTVEDIPWRSMSEDVRQARAEYVEFGRQIQEAETDERRLTAAIEQGDAMIGQARADIEDYSRSLEKAGDTAEAEVIEGLGQIGPVVNDATQSIEELMEAYTEAYEAAVKSIQGQYALWDDVKEVSAVSADTINSKIEKQTEYWSKYNENLEALRARTGEIEGLGDVISSFADGSADSVNAIAGMAKASDEDLAEMVKSYKALQEAQTETGENLAAMVTEFDLQTETAAGHVADMVADMDLSVEAKRAAISTLNGYIAGLNEQSGPLSTAFGQIYGAARRGILWNNTPAVGYASGTDNAEPGLHLVGEEGPELLYFKGGEKVIPADETKKILEQAQIQPTMADSETTKIIELQKEYQSNKYLYQMPKGYAGGTENADPGLHLVGEEGPELLFVKDRKKTIPAGETKEIPRQTQAQFIKDRGDTAKIIELQREYTVRNKDVRDDLKLREDYQALQKDAEAAWPPIENRPDRNGTRSNDAVFLADGVQQIHEIAQPSIESRKEADKIVELQKEYMVNRQMVQTAEPAAVPSYERTAQAEYRSGRTDDDANILKIPQYSSGGDTTNNIEVRFEIAGNATQDVVEQLRQYGDQLAEQVADIIEERDQNRRRRAYA